MPNLKLEIEYDGSDYCGWQVQNDSLVKSHRSKKAIQEIIEKALRKILQEKVRLISAGRTDAGVHAQAQVANFLTNSYIGVKKLQKALNCLLPKDISISKIEESRLDFHSRFDAQSKVYRYVILNRNYPSALLRKQAYFCSYALNISLMQREARSLLGKHDFKAFCASGSSAKNTIRTIKKISVRKLGSRFSGFGSRFKDSLIVIDIEADGFLYNMARSIVGTLIEIGRGRFKKGHLRRLLHSKDRNSTGPTAPACGLCLMKVKY